VTVFEPVPASFTVSHRGPPLAYQWRRGGVTLRSDRSSSTLNPTSVAADNGAQLVCGDQCRFGTRWVATLTVNAAGRFRPTVCLWLRGERGRVLNGSGVTSGAINLGITDATAGIRQPAGAGGCGRQRQKSVVGLRGE